MNLADQLEFVILSFEGPDPYAMAGGLGTRVTHLAHELASRGITTHLLFIGDPDRMGHEPLMGGKLVFHRWCQWISHYHRLGVYDGEEDKLADYTTSVPPFVVEHLLPNAAAQGKQVVILAEEWHTAETISRIHDLLESRHTRHQAVLVWNANNTCGFDRIDWQRLAKRVTLTTVSRYMKHLMLPYGVNPLVIPNGIPSDLLQATDLAPVQRIRSALSGAMRPLLLKVGRFDPAKGWLTSIEAFARLKAKGYQATFLCRGGIESHSLEVLNHTRALDLKVVDVDGKPETAEEVLDLILQSGEGDLFNLRFQMAQEMLRPYYAAADVVLANSIHEPFGLVGLEAMAAGGVVFTGATGECYSEDGVGAVAMDTYDPEEIVYHLETLMARPDLADNLRRSAIRVAARYTWNKMVDRLLDKLGFAACTQQASFPLPALRHTPELSIPVFWQDQVKNQPGRRM